MADPPSKRRRGRPPVDPAGGPSTNLHVRIPAADYDALYVKARQARTDIATLVRRTLKAATAKP